MPRVPTHSPATSQPTSSSFVHTVACNFVDNAGRTLLLRGVNLSGSSKAPVGQPSWVHEGFWDDAEAGGKSFVGRPLDLDDGSADVHLARLRGWGFNMLRFPITWEALEHEGPGIYDYDFMDYTIRVLKKCKEYGFKVFCNPHQDVWSRFSGGSGAPFWTLPACGMNPRNITATQAAILHCEYPSTTSPDPASLPAMIWSTNYGRLLSQTIFTLFFAGRDFAPRCILDGKNIQDWLQDHFIGAIGAFADRIQTTAPELLDDCVIGWDSMNEPGEGLVGWKDLNLNPTGQGSTLAKGSKPTPIESMRLGMGQAQTVDHIHFGMFGPTKDGTITIDPKGLKIWVDQDTEDEDGVHPKWGWKRDKGWPLGTCIWGLHGVWDVESGTVIRPDYFRRPPFSDDQQYDPAQADVNGGGEEGKGEEDVEFITDYWVPHFEAYAKRIRATQPEAILFIQPPVFAPPPPIHEDVLQGRATNSSHYYDGLTLVTRHWNWFNADALGMIRGKYSSPLGAVKIGENAIRKSIQEQLGIIKSDTLTVGDYPTLIGEIGIPYDMDSKRSYGWTDEGRYLGDYSRQEKALDASLNAADGPNGLNYTVWTYCPDSSHEWGDGWNMEDLSLWSEDDLVSRRPFMRSSITSASASVSGGNVEDKEDDETTTVDDRSRTNLLQQFKKQKHTKLKATASVFSLATLGLGLSNGSAMFDELMDKQRAELELRRWRENAWEFLTDGARAVRAFCRPFPIKTVGVPKDIQFDLNKAIFKLKVTVKPEDRPVTGALGEGEDETAAEIYVPLVHYANERFVKVFERGSTVTSRAASMESLALSANSRMKNSSNNTNNGSTTTLPQLPKLTLSTSTSTTTIAAPVGGGNATSPPSPTGSTSSSLSSSLADKDILDIEVSVSGGRWSVEGQTLKWWYDVPSTEGEEREYTIEIRRRTGPIKIKDSEATCWCPGGQSGCTIM